MKQSIIKITGLSLMIALAATSCKKAFFPDGINTDPNASTKANLIPNTLLPGAEYSMAYTIGGDVSRFSSDMVQSVRGLYRQFAAYDQYVYTAQDFDNTWSNFYEQDLNNIYTLIHLADQNGYTYYGGIARTLMAYNIGMVSDMWGDVPYSQAFRGDSAVLQPKYDKQQDIYDSVFSLLTTAITQLSASSGGNVQPGQDDFIYGGDPKEWLKLAYSLEARYYLHLSRSNASYADQIIAILPNVISSNDDNAQVPFYNDNTQANPWYQYVTQRGDIGYDEGYLYKLMVSQTDPRLPLFIDTANDNIGNAIGAFNAPVPVMTFSEMKFIEAEARSSKGDVAGATSAYHDAIAASFTSLGLTSAAADAYVTANPLTGADHPTRLTGIITQKYEALFSQPEAFNDERRTGIPALTPVTGANLPQRFIYVQAELDHNAPNVPTGTSLFTKVWWAQ